METGYRPIRVATSGRRCRLYVGTIKGRRLPGGPRPIEQIVAVVAGLAATTAASWVSNYPVPAVFAAGILITAAITVTVGRIPYDGVPIMTTVWRTTALLVARRPTIVAAEDLARQDATGAFLAASAEEESVSA